MKPIQATGMTRSRLVNILTGALCLILLSGCASGTGSSSTTGTTLGGTSASNGTAPEPDTITLQGLVLTNGTIYVTSAPAVNGLSDNLLTIHLPAGTAIPGPGALAEYVIEGAIAESYPPQATGLSSRILQAESPVIEAPINIGTQILFHLQNQAILADVRTPSEFAAGHLEGAVNLPVDAIAKDIAAKAPSKDTTLLVYCRSGSRSAAAAAELKSMGYRIVLDLGGILDFDGELIQGEP